MKFNIDLPETVTKPIVVRELAAEYDKLAAKSSDPKLRKSIREVLKHYMTPDEYHAWGSRQP